MGVSQFVDQPPLPAVPLELSAIVDGQQTQQGQSGVWQGRSFLNESSTLKNLKLQLQSEDYSIVHLATHAVFQSGSPARSQIQLWGAPVSLTQMGQLPWKDLDLLVLSACQTAVGDEEAELGFAGLALQAGAKSAIASLWSVSDAGTLALMSEFCQQLPQASSKAEALRQAQIRLLRGEVRFERSEARGGRLRLSRGEVVLPRTLPLPTQDDLSNPFYWAGFMMTANP